MELIKVLQSFGLTVENIDEMSDEELQKMIDEHVKEKEEHIKTLETEKETLSKSNEELTASVEGEKADKEKLDKELSDLRLDKQKVDKELSETKGRLSQVTDMYKEQFSKAPEEQATVKDDKVINDTLQFILDAK